MRRGWIFASLLLGLALATSDAAASTPRNVVRAADGGVVAVQADEGSGVGVVVGLPAVVVAPDLIGSISVVSTSGESADVELDAREGDLAAGPAPDGLGLTALEPVGELRKADNVYLVGSPLGFDNSTVRKVDLRLADGGSRPDPTQPGTLPKALLGAALIDGEGGLVGVVSSISGRSWTIGRPSELAALTSVVEGDGESGIPLWGIAAAAILLLCAMAGVVAVVSRRRRRTPVGSPPATIPAQPPPGPVVRRREPKPEASEGPDAETVEDDFEVLVKPREEA